MGTKFSEDVIPLTDLKINPGRVVKHATDAHRPVLLTRRGRGVAVVQSVKDYESAEEERAFMRAVVVGLADIEAGRELSLADAKARLGLKSSVFACAIRERDHIINTKLNPITIKPQYITGA